MLDITEPTLRDVDRWKDRIELSLDGRQLFFLFFGCAVVACLVFVLGVLVGERVARHRLVAPALGSDPLAALDALEGTGPDPGLAAIAAAPRAAAVAEPALAMQPPLPFHGNLTSGTSSAEGPLSDVPQQAVAKAASPARSAAPGNTPKAASGRIAAATAKNPASHATSKGRYTVQLSSFEDRSEAEKFARRLAADGFEPTVYSAEVPGKGTWYRVRIGELATKREAIQARNDLEHREQLTAYVAKLPPAAAAVPPGTSSSAGTAAAEQGASASGSP